MFKFYYGVMASGKSASLLMSAYQKEKDGHSVLVLKPYDKRDKKAGKLYYPLICIQRICALFSRSYYDFAH